MSFIQKNNKDVYDCHNYPCLSLKSCLGKLFTTLLQSRLHNYMEDNDLNFRPDLDQDRELQITFLRLKRF